MDWKNKISRMRGYGMGKYDKFIVLDKENEIWGTNDLIDFIESIIADDFDKADEDEKDYLRSECAGMGIEDIS